MIRKQIKKTGLKLMRKKRIVAGIVILSMLIGMHSVLVSAGNTDDPTLCEHHQVHDEECGYTEGSEGAPCTHEHTEDCYEDVTFCIHEHDHECGAVADDGTVDESLCTHVCSLDNGCITRKTKCGHDDGIHDDTCGYIEATEGTPCQYECKICLVQDIIDSLPDKDELEKMNDDDLLKAKENLDIIYTAIYGMGSDVDEIDTTRLNETAVFLEERGIGTDDDKEKNTPDPNVNLLRNTTTYNYDQNTGTLTIIPGDSKKSGWKLKIIRAMVTGKIM